MLLSWKHNKSELGIFKYRELVAELPFILMHPKPYGLNDMDLICKEFISPSKGTSIKSNRSSFNSINVIAKPEEPDLIEM